MRGRILGIRDVHPASFSCPSSSSSLCPFPMQTHQTFSALSWISLDSDSELPSRALSPAMPLPAVIVVRICYVLERSLGVSPQHCESQGCRPQRMFQSGLILSEIKVSFQNAEGNVLKSLGGLVFFPCHPFFYELQRQKELPPTCSLPQYPQGPGPWLGSWGLRSPTWLAGTYFFEPSPLPPIVCISSKLDSEARAGNRTQAF